MIKAVVFDCFGVLVRSGWIPFREQYFGHDSELMEQARDIGRMKDSGLLTHIDFVRAVAELAGIDEESARQQIEDNPPNTQLFELIRDSFKPTYKIGLLSNAGADRLDELFEPWQRALFDDVVLSYQIGAVKPEPMTYQAICDRLGANPSKCLFIDDQKRYCEGAEAVGMSAIHYQDNRELLKNIGNYNIFV